MSANVGSLNATLTLDMSNFQAGMAAARSMASDLASVLQQVFNPGGMGVAEMDREIQTLIASIAQLRAELVELQAIQNSMSGADIFASMKANIDALPTTIAQIQTEISNLSTAFYSLNDDIELIIYNIQSGLSTAFGPFQGTITNIQSSLSTLASASSQVAGAVQSLGTASTTIDFSIPLGQLRDMLTSVNNITEAMRAWATMDISSGEVDEDDMGMDRSLTNALLTLNEIDASLQRVALSLQACIAHTQQWAAELKLVYSQMGSIMAAASQMSGSVRNIPNQMGKATQNTKQFGNQVKKVEKNLQTAKGYAVSIQGIIGGIIVAQSFYNLLDIMQRIVQGAKEFSMAMQDASVSFNYLMKYDSSGVTGGSILNALTNIAQTSPMATSSLIDASRQLMAMGFSAKSTVPALNILVDTAAAVGGSASEMTDKIQHITLAFGQMIAAGKVSAQELRQLYNAGLPIYELLSKGLGISMRDAKQIGKLNVDSASAVFAVLQQLQDRYAGAAKDLSRTVAGSLQVIREALQVTMARAWQPYFEALNKQLNNMADRFVAFSKITHAYGVGGLFQAIFPRELWGYLRGCIAGIIQLGRAFSDVARIILSSFGTAMAWLVRICGTILPVIGNVVRIITSLARAAYTTYPAIRLLLSSLYLLVIAGVVARLVIVLAKAIWFLTGAQAAAKAVAMLAKALVGLYVAHPVTFALLAIATAFLAIVAASEKARAAIARFFGKAAGKLQNFTENLGIGIDPSKIAMPEFNLPEMDDFSVGVEDMVDSMDDLANAEDEASKKAKKLKDNLQSFDEVYRIGEEDQSGGDDLGPFDGLLDKLKGIGDLNYSDLFDWTGDWETDWANLSAGLEDFIDDLGEGIGAVKDWMKELISSITGGGSALDLLDIFDALSLLFAMLGNFKLAGIFQIVEGLLKIFDAISDALDYGWNFDNIMQLIDGLGDVIIGLGLLTKNWKLVGFGLVIQGLHDIIKGLKKIVTEGFNVDAVMDVIEGIGKVIAGLGLLTGNFRLAGVGFIISGLAKIIRELAENWKAITQGDWSGVNKIALITGVIELLAGLLLALGVFSRLRGVKRAMDAGTTVARAGEAAGKMNKTLKESVNPKLASLFVNLGLALGIIAEVCAAILAIVGTILLLGMMFKKMAEVWTFTTDEVITCLQAMSLGMAILLAVGILMHKLGSYGMALLVQMSIGAAIIGEVCLVAEVLAGSILLLGIIFQKIIDVWTPVMNNMYDLQVALFNGVSILATVGVAMAALGSFGTTLIEQMTVGAFVIGEICVVTEVLAAAILLLGFILQGVIFAWEPVLANMSTLWNALLTGTAIMLTVGAAMAALGAAGETVVTQMTTGAIVLGAICVATDLFVANMALLGGLLLLVIAAWEPVLNNLNILGPALLLGTSLLVIVGATCAALGTAGAEMAAAVIGGAVMLAAICAATDILIVNIALMGLVLQAVVATWEPVLANLPAVAASIGAGVVLLLAVGAACAGLGTLGEGLVGPITAGALLLAEVSIVTDLFLVEVAAIGLLMQAVIAAWEPVLAHAGTAAKAIATGTGLLLAVGAACAALGAATVATGGTIPLAIAIGTALLVECAIAVEALIASITDIANQISTQLTPALLRVNTVIPATITAMERFVEFMSDFAQASSSLTSSMGSLTWDGIVQGFFSLFQGDPLGDMTKKIEQIGNDISALNSQLIRANNELRQFFPNLQTYNTFMEKMQLLCKEGGTATLQSGMFTNLKKIGENLVLGLIEGMNVQKPQAQSTAQQLGSSIVTSLNGSVRQGGSQLRSSSESMGLQTMQGLQSGIDRGNTTLISRLQSIFGQIRNLFKTFFGGSEWSQYGANICNGLSQGISNGAEKIKAKAKELADNVKNTMKSSLDMHSPSRVMMQFGEYIDDGLALGMSQNIKKVTQAAQDVAGSLTSSMEQVETPSLSLDAVSSNSLTEIQTWADGFVSILENMFMRISELFTGLSEHLPALNGGKGIEAKIGSVQAADKLAAQATTPHGANQEKVALDEETIRLLTSQAADRIYEYLAPLFASQGGGADQERINAYIGTLVADDTGLRELERKLNVIRLSEGRRF